LLGEELKHQLMKLHSASIISSLVSAIILFSSCSSGDLVDIEKEKALIKGVIANETETYFRQDFEGWKKNFLEDPAFRQYSYWEGWPYKVQYYNGFDTLKLVKKAQFDENRTIWKGSMEVRRNENLRVSRDMAWYTFEQYSYEKDTQKFLGKSLETRILEKVNGEWKIAYLGYHYLPMDSTVDN
jgi:hypothetical protein